MVHVFYRPSMPARGAVALALLGSLVNAQTTAAAPAPPRHATVIAATGEVIRDAPDKSATLVTVWANTDYSGNYGLPAPSQWLDWGAITTTSGSDIVGQYTFAYATTAPDAGAGASICTEFYPGAVGHCAEEGQRLLPEASFCFSGLPGSTNGAPAAWIVTVVLTGGHEYRQGAGPFGFAVRGMDAETGPLLCYANGTSEDALDQYWPDVAVGVCYTFGFGGPPHDYASLYLSIETADAAAGPYASATPRNGSGANPFAYLSTPPVLGKELEAFVVPPPPNVGAILVGYTAPLTAATPWGELLVDLTSPGGELLLLPPSFGMPARFTLSLPLDLTLCGTGVHTQAVGVGGRIALLNAVDWVLGL